MIHFILIVTPLILSVRTTPASNETLEDARSAVECNETWVDGSSVGLGYLWFETSRTYSYSSAIAFCESRNSSLIEIDSQEQWKFTIAKLKNISEKVPWRISSDGYIWQGWWGGATNEKDGGKWVWTQSGVPVQDFAWGEGQPNIQNWNPNGQGYFCFYISPDYGLKNFVGNDFSGHEKIYPLCQQKRYL